MFPSSHQKITNPVFILFGDFSLCSTNREASKHKYMHINYMGDDEIVHPDDLAFPHVPDDNYGAESDDLTVGPAKKFKLTTLPL